MSYQEECIELRAEIDKGKGIIAQYEHERDKANTIRNWMIFFMFIFLASSIYFLIQWKDAESYNKILQKFWKKWFCVLTEW